jgi:hypothetical protein
MNDPSLLNASRHTHAKIGLLAVAASLVFVAVVSASGLAKMDGARMSGPVVKASTLINVATSDKTMVR